jgi:hypothetical protein
VNCGGIKTQLSRVVKKKDHNVTKGANSGVGVLRANMISFILLRSSSSLAGGGS